MKRDLPEQVFESRHGWRAPDLMELWRYRELMLILAWRDVQVRYKQTVLGALWAILQPTLFMVVFTLTIGRVRGAHHGDIPYPLFLYAGLLPWTFFSTIVLSASNSVVDSERLVTKVYFPRLAIPFAVAGVAIIDFMIASVLLLGMLVYYRVAPTWELLLAPVTMLIVLIAALGTGTLLATLNVTYRDVRYALPFLLQIAMFATPAIYLDAFSPGSLEGTNSGLLALIIDWNPMATLVATFRTAVVGARGGHMPWTALAVIGAVTIAYFIAASAIFRRVEDSFADVI